MDEEEFDYDIEGTIEDKREDIRGWLAKAMTFIFGFTIGAIFVSYWLGVDISIFDFVFSGVTGVFGVMIGFYFGSRI